MKNQYLNFAEADTTNQGCTYYAYCNTCQKRLSNNFPTEAQAYPFANQHRSSNPGHQTTVKVTC